MIEEKIDDIKRLDEIVSILVKEEAGLILDKLDLEHKIPLHKRLNLDRDKKPAPRRLRETIEELGPTFIKFGQILAQRPDVVPQKYIEELEKLEDSAPHFSPKKARTIIQEEIGLKNFKHVEEEPLAAASIAQVHKAELKTGEKVIIKVRRPGIEKKMQTDLEILQAFTKQLESHFTKAKNMQIQKVVKEFSRWTKGELDFRKEQQNAEIFKENLADEEKIRAPETYADLTTEKVLVMEYVDGVKCTEQEKLRDLEIENEEIARTIVRGVLKQSIRDGFFHADPHPSNFLIEEDSTIVYLDFGMMGKMTKKNRDLLGLLLLHAMNEDVESGLQTVKQMAYVEEEANLDELKQIIEEKLLRLNNNTIEEVSISRELLDLSVQASKRGVHMPSSMTLVGKSLLTMEGIGLTIYPEFQIDEEYQKITKKLLKENNSPQKMTETLMIDLIQNQDLITKLPTKINDKLESEEKTKTVVTQNTQNSINGKHIFGATLLISSTFLLYNALTLEIQAYLGAIAALIAIYIFLTN